MAAVRRAVPGDAPAIARMLHDFNEEFGDPSPGPAVLEPRVRAFIVNGAKDYLITADGPHGFAQVDFAASVWAEDPVGRLEELYVAPDRRGGGIGRALMEAVLELADERGAAGMEVVTGGTDVAARALYESVGFSNRIEGPDGSRSLFYELSF